MTSTVLKEEKEDVLDAAWQFYEACLADAKPRRICRVSPTMMSYALEPGMMPDDWRVVMRAAARHLWVPAPTAPVPTQHKLTYCEYIRHRAEESDAETPMVHRALQCIVESHLTPARLCHGDLTLKNCVQNGQRIVFLDPGNTRGVSCTELDLGKILQSLEGLDEVMHGWKRPPWYDFHKLSNYEIIRAFYVTHLVRILRQPHVEERVKAWCRERIS